MADVKISALPAAIALDGTELLAGVQAAATKKLTVQQVMDFVNTFGAANRFAGFDSGGELEAIPGFSIDTISGGLNEQLTYQPNNLGGGNTANILAMNFDPLQNSPDDDWNIQQIQANFDVNSSGFTQGTNGEAATLLNLFATHHGTGNVGGLSHVKSFYDLGNGTDPITVKGIGYMFAFGDINSGVTIDGGIQGFDFQPHLHPGAICGASFNSYAFNDGLNSEIALDGHNSFQASPQFLAVTNGHNYNSISLFPTITTLTGNASYYGAVVGGTITTMGASSVVQGLQFTPTITTSHGNVNGISITPTINGGDANFTAMQINLQGSATGLGNLRGIVVNLSGHSSTDPEGAISFESDSRISVNASVELASGNSFMICNRLEGLVHSTLGTPITGTDSLGNDLAGDIWCEDSVADGPTAGLVGVTGTGFISSIIVGSGKVVDTANVFLVACALPDPGVGHTFGGTITNFNNLKIAPPLNQGGSLIVTNYKALNIAGDFSSFGAASTWGLYVEDTALNNHIGGNLDLGTLNMSGNISFSADNTYNIGSPTNRARFGYIEFINNAADFTVADFVGNIFYDELENVAIAFASGGRNLYDVAGSVTLDWESGTLSDPGGLVSVDWSQRRLNDVDGSTTLFQWGSGIVLLEDAHLVSGAQVAPTVAVTGNAGTGASASLALATDVAGKITFAEGTVGLASGAQLTVTFAQAYDNAPIVQIQATNSAAATTTVGVFITSTTTGFTINFATASVALTGYSWNYFVIGT